MISMDGGMLETKKGANLIIKTWERCKSIGRGKKPFTATKLTSRSFKEKSKSWPRTRNQRRGVIAPEGCFSVYVGPEKQRFVIKTEYANHLLFKALLEEAESEYGYSPEGPLLLPCNVETFIKVLAAIDSNDDDDDLQTRKGCGIMVNYTPYRLLSPSRVIALNQF